MKTFIILYSILFPNRIVPEPVMDWAFIDAQERWVVESQGPEAMLAQAPVDIRHYLDAMSSHNYLVRDWGSRSMLRQGRGAVTWCFVAQYLPDPEVRLRCRNVLRKVSACQMCGGKGGTQQSWGFMGCHVCQTVGHHWPLEDMVDAER